MSEKQVIAAIATGTSQSGIGVIRISGNEAFSVVEKVFFPVDESKKVSEQKGYTALYGRICHNGGFIDDGIALVFRAPHSFTGENTVELSVHGGRYVLSRVMEALIFAGARQAKAGEFSRRAFLNGKLDLTAAKAIMDTVSAQGEMQLRAASARRNGAMYKKTTLLRSHLADICAHAAAWCDFPEEDVEELTTDALMQGLNDAKTKIERLVKSAETGIAVTNGIRVCIAGRPNVGKSTVMNLLASCEKSIVTDIAGTTRDVVETAVNIKGITLNLADTAGLRDTEDLVEKIGVERSRSYLSSAAFVIAVFDGSLPPEDEDMALIEEIKSRPCVAVINKADLGLDTEAEKCYSQLENAVFISAKNEDSKEVLADKISSVLSLTGEDLDGGILSDLREKEAALAALAAVNSAIDAVNNGFPPDITAVCVEDAVSFLGEITGETASETVIEKVFANFCVGK